MPDPYIILWGELRLGSWVAAGGVETVDVETLDATLDLDEWQVWFQTNPQHPGFKQIVINLSGAQWEQIKDLPIVAERSEAR